MVFDVFLEKCIGQAVRAAFKTEVMPEIERLVKAAVTPREIPTKRAERDTDDKLDTLRNEVKEASRKLGDFGKLKRA